MKYNNSNLGAKPINFPEEEMKKLSGQKIIITTIGDKDYDKYNVGDLVVTPWMAVYQILKRQNFKKIEEHPFYNKLTSFQINLVSKYKKYCVLTLFKLERK
jgi:hypothetical protein